MLPQPLGAGLVQHFRSPPPPYRGEDLRFLTEIEDRDQPTLPIDDMERDIVHKAAGTVRYYRDAEGFQQGAESLLVVGARRDPKAAIRTMRLRIFFERFGTVTQIEADADQSDLFGESIRTYLIAQLRERLAQSNADRGAGRVDELDHNRPSDLVCEGQLSALHVDQANCGYRPGLLDNGKSARALRGERPEAVGALP